MKNYKVLRPIHPNAGLVAAYRFKLEKLIDELHRSVIYWLKAAYRLNPPIMAQDFVLPAHALQRTIKKLRKRWLKRFNDAALLLARYFTKSINLRTDAALKNILKDAGISVEMQMTPAMRDIFAASVNENVSLIRSIPEQYLYDVEGIVTRSVRSGYKLNYIADEVQKRYALTRKRARLIARDQTNKITSNFTRARQIENGFEQAVWLHSHAGKKPRQTHVANNGKLYNIREGWLDPAINKRIWPGTEINCRCVSKSIVQGLV